MLNHVRADDGARFHLARRSQDRITSGQQLYFGAVLGRPSCCGQPISIRIERNQPRSHGVDVESPAISTAIVDDGVVSISVEGEADQESILLVPNCAVGGRADEAIVAIRIHVAVLRPLLHIVTVRVLTERRSRARTDESSTGYLVPHESRVFVRLSTRNPRAGDLPAAQRDCSGTRSRVRVAWTGYLGV